MQLNPASAAAHAAAASAALPLASPLRAALAAATSALLAPAVLAQGATPSPAPSPAPAADGPTPTRTPAAAASPAEWKLDSAVLFYSEAGGRIRLVEPVFSARRTDGNERTLGLKLTLDALTGASPNGAVPQPVAQTFTSPSGEATYTTAAGATPLDPSFRDSRVALAASLEQPIGQAQRLSLVASLSNEYDFQSLGASAALARDFNDKNTTATLGLAFEGNRSKPVGGTPVGLRPAFGALSQRKPDETRNVVDLLLGLTQVVSREWLMQFNLGVGRGSGIHTDPYKLLSVVDGTTGLVTGDRYVSEERPRARTRWSLYWQNKLHLSRDIVDLSYRYYRDDWGIAAHTLDARYRFELSQRTSGLHVEPRWRHHRQSAADFWRGWLVEGGEWSSTAHRAGVAAASADPRLGAFDADTLGVKLGWGGGEGKRAGEWSLRLESYRQRPDRPAGAPGVLQTLDLAQTLKATLVLLGYGASF